MTSKIVECAGLALARHVHAGADYGMDGDAAYAVRRADFDGQARAVIRVLREPTEAQLFKMCQCDRSVDIGVVRRIYAAAIEEALR